MRLHLWERATPPHNFGDQLNRWLWPRLLAGLPPVGDDVALVGLGTLLGRAVPLPEARHLLIVGAGTGYGPPHPVDARWRIYAVRGPLTATALALDPRLAAGDPGLLVAEYLLPAPGAIRATVGVMPHWRSASAGWQQLCDAEGWRYLDPTAAPGDLLPALAGCDVLVTEALHGAIVADALRIPWIPVVAGSEVLRFKWVDCCRALDLHWTPSAVPRLYAGRPDRLGRLKTGLRQGMAAAVIRQLLVRGERHLSREATLAQLRAHWRRIIGRLRDDLASGHLPVATGSRP